MGRYLWQGSDSQQQPVQGVEQAPNHWLLGLILAHKGIKMLACHRVCRWHLRPRLVSAEERLYLLQQWQRMVSAQLPILEVVRLSVPAKASVNLRWQLWQLQQALGAGNTFAKALKLSKLLSDVDIAMLSAAEASGQLGFVLSQLVDQGTGHQRFKQQLRRALLMPTITLVVGLMVALTLLLWLVPNMAGLIAGQAAQLPPLTAQLVEVSSWLQQSWMGLLGFFALLISSLWWASKSAYVGSKLLALLSHAPVLGQLLIWQQQWRLFQILATGMQGGLTLMRSLDMYLPSCQLPLMHRQIACIKQRLLAGDALAVGFARAGLPEQQVLMLSMAQQTGQVAKACQQIATDLEGQLQVRMQHLQGLFEPLITLLLAGLVGGLVLAIYLPLLQLGSMLR